MNKKRLVNGWDDVTLDVYKKMDSVLKSVDNVISKEVRMLEIFYDCTMDELLDMSVDNIASMIASCGFVNGAIPELPMPERIVFGDIEFRLVKDIRSCSYAQFVDFQTYMKKPNENRAELLSCLLVPVKGRYNKGYELDGLISWLGANIRIGEFNAFFLTLEKGLRDSILRTADYLEGLKPVSKKNREMVRNLNQIGEKVRLMVTLGSDF
jgi:hypothetical protein